MNNGVPKLSPEARRATYVVWLLGISPGRVFPLGPECSAESDDYLFDWVYLEVRRLLDELYQAQVWNPEVSRYVKTLVHAHDVIEGRADPADNGWHLNKKNYRRGVYVFHNVRPHKTGEAPA